MTEAEIVKKSSSRKLIITLLTGLVLSFIVNMVMFVMVLGSLQQIYRHIGVITSICEETQRCGKTTSSELHSAITRAEESFAEKKKKANK